MLAIVMDLGRADLAGGNVTGPRLMLLSRYRKLSVLSDALGSNLVFSHSRGNAGSGQEQFKILR